MKTTQITEKMPGFVKETIGQAQKRLDLIEDGARKFVLGTWIKVRQNDSLKMVEKTIDGWRMRFNGSIDSTTLRKTAESIGNEYSGKAFHAFGLATHGDILGVERKVERLRLDVRKLTRMGKAGTMAKPKARPNAKPRSKPKSKTRTKR